MPPTHVVARHKFRHPCDWCGAVNNTCRTVNSTAVINGKALLYSTGVGCSECCNLAFDIDFQTQVFVDVEREGDSQDEEIARRNRRLYELGLNAKNAREVYKEDFSHWSWDDDADAESTPEVQSTPEEALDEPVEPVVEDEKNLQV